MITKKMIMKKQLLVMALIAFFGFAFNVRATGTATEIENCLNDASSRGNLILNVVDNGADGIKATSEYQAPSECMNLMKGYKVNFVFKLDMAGLAFLDKKLENFEDTINNSGKASISFSTTYNAIANAMGDSSASYASLYAELQHDPSTAQGWAGTNITAKTNSVNIALTGSLHGGTTSNVNNGINDNSSTSGNLINNNTNNDSGFPPVNPGGFPPVVTGQQITVENPVNATSVVALVDSVAYWAYNIGLVLAVIVNVIIGLQFMMAGGNDEKVTKAKRNFLWAIVGIAILLLSKALIGLIKSVLGG